MWFTVLVFTAMAGITCGQTDAQSSELFDLINSTQGLSYLASFAAVFPEVLETVSGLSNITILAPSNNAFEALETDPRGEALYAASQEDYLNLIYYHILNGTYDNITDYEIVSTLLTNSNYTNVTGGQVVGAYFDDDDGEVGFYSGLDINPEAPQPPLTFSGGILYIINKVLNVPVSVSKTVVGKETNGTLFVGVLNEAGLREEVEQLPDTTFFVPINEGFESVEEILAGLGSEELAGILKYHVVPGTIQYNDILQNSTSLTTLQGDNVTVSVTQDEAIFINGAAIIYYDLIVANGVVHLIDNVLNPNATFTVPVNGTDGGSPAFEGAVITPAPTATGDAASSESSASATSLVSSLPSEGAARPMNTAAVGAAVLFGGAALAFNI